MVQLQRTDIASRGLDTSKYTGQMNYISISTQDEAYWQIPVQAVTIDNQTVSGVVSIPTLYLAEFALMRPVRPIVKPQSTLAPPSSVFPRPTLARSMPRFLGRRICPPHPATRGIISTHVIRRSRYRCSSGGSATPYRTPISTLAHLLGIHRCAPARSSKWTCECRRILPPHFHVLTFSSGSQAPISWIVGASFLKNVYSSFRFNPAAIGFAQLSGTAASVSNGTNSSMSSTTGGGTAGSGGTGSSSGAGRGIKAGLWSLEVSIVGVAALIVSLL